jgi:hypothetical protein
MKSRVSRIAVLFLINAIMIFLFFNLIYWSLPVLQLAMGRTAAASALAVADAHLPNYANIDWAEQHFRELMQAQPNVSDHARTDFKSYIGWRRHVFSGQTINVEGPYAQRRTINKDQAADAKRVYFFGGSSMWGTGANDAGTIPSQFAALTQMRADNFAEAGYTAHQNLMLLIRLLQEGHQPDLVVFYDGVNEVAIKCVTELTPDAHMLEAEIDTLLKRPSRSPASFAHYLAPIFHVAGSINGRLTRAAGSAPADGFNCHSNSDKATKIAENVLRDWLMAKRIVESYGAKFIATLQPAIYFSRTRRDHLEDAPRLMSAQFQAVYPLIKERLPKASGFYDLTSALDVDEYVYIDFCHLSPNGNRLIAARMVELMASLNSGPRP